MKIKVQLVKNVDDLIVGKNNLLISFFCYITNSLRPRRNTNASQSGAENEERM
jgi:hypothetical protein